MVSFRLEKIGSEQGNAWPEMARKPPLAARLAAARRLHNGVSGALLPPWLPWLFESIVSIAYILVHVAVSRH
jgi:hypothetical protein